MSSETSTEPQHSFEPWQLFTLAGLIGATIAVFMARGESPAAVIMISLTIFAAAAVGMAALRTFLPLTQKSAIEGARILGGRTRAALEREKTLVLRSIKELEFDRAMGKVSEKDFVEMGGRLRARAAGLMRQLDAGAGYRNEIEREIVKRIGPSARQQGVGGSVVQEPIGGLEQDSNGGYREQDPPYGRHESIGGSKVHEPPYRSQEPIVGSITQEPPDESEKPMVEDVGRVLPSRPAIVCASCSTVNDPDARFCKHCGGAMEARS